MWRDYKGRCDRNYLASQLCPMICRAVTYACLACNKKRIEIMWTKCSTWLNLLNWVSDRRLQKTSEEKCHIKEITSFHLSHAAWIIEPLSCAWKNELTEWMRHKFSARDDFLRVQREHKRRHDPLWHTSRFESNSVASNPSKWRRRFELTVDTNILLMRFPSTFPKYFPKLKLNVDIAADVYRLHFPSSKVGGPIQMSSFKSVSAIVHPSKSSTSTIWDDPA